MSASIPQNSTCEAYYHSPALNLTGFLLVWSISKCLEEQAAGAGARGVAEFVMKVANDYFTDSKQVKCLVCIFSLLNLKLIRIHAQVMVLYDESWEINDMVEKLGTTTTKSFVLYFLPLDPSLGFRINTSELKSSKI